MRCKKPLLGNVLVISKHFKEEAEKNDKLILWYISEVFRPLWEQYLYSCLGTDGNSFFPSFRRVAWPETKRERGNVLFPSHDFCSYQREWLAMFIDSIRRESPSMHYLYKVFCTQSFLWNLPCLEIVHAGIGKIWQLAFFWSLHFHM